MPGKGGLGGATSWSVESGSPSVDCDMRVVLLRISVSRSVRGSSDWLESGRELGLQKATEHTQGLRVRVDHGREARGAGAKKQEPWTQS